MNEADEVVTLTVEVRRAEMELIEEIAKRRGVPRTLVLREAIVLKAFFDERRDDRVLLKKRGGTLLEVKF